jgi:recombination protein RecA
MTAATAARLADLESLLRARKLGATLAPAAAPSGGTDADVARFGVPALDIALGGGLARGHMSELVGPASSGRTTLLCRLIADATCRGEVVALVDAFDTFDPESAAAAGVDLSRVLWVRAGTVDRAVKTVALVLQAGGFSIVVLDLATATPHALARVPFTTWMRMQRLVDGRATACVLVTPTPLGRSPGGVTLTLASRARWAGGSNRARLFRGFELDIRIRRTRIAHEAIANVTVDEAGEISCLPASTFPASPTGRRRRATRFSV